MKKKINPSLLLLAAVMLFPNCSKDNEIVNNDFTSESGKFIDERDGHEYKWVKIGTQIWMAENFKATTFNDGTNIPLIVAPTAWESLDSPAYHWVDNDEAKNKYLGPLYNWYTVATKKLAPKGWHIPSIAEWEEMNYYLAGDSVERNVAHMLKQTNINIWDEPDMPSDMFSIATNQSGFSALPTMGNLNDGGSTTFWSLSEDQYKYNTARFYIIGATDLLYYFTEIKTHGA